MNGGNSPTPPNYGRQTVFVSGPLAYVGNVRAVQVECERRGWTVNYDWTKHGHDGAVRDESSEVQEKVAEEEVLAASDCDLLVSVQAKDAGRGTYVEMGAALAMGTPVLIVGINIEDDFMNFRNHPLVTTTTLAEFLQQS